MLLRGAGGEGDVEAAFSGRLFPPPASGAGVLAHPHRPGAGRAANGGKAAIVQRVVGDLERPDLQRHRLGSPVEQRVGLEQAARGVPCDERYVGPRAGLADAQAGNPARRAVQRPRERCDLAHAAACLARGPAVIEAVRSLCDVQRLQRSRVGVECPDANAEAALCLRPDLVGLRKQTAVV